MLIVVLVLGLEVLMKSHLGMVLIMEKKPVVSLIENLLNKRLDEEMVGSGRDPRS